MSSYLYPFNRIKYEKRYFWTLQEALNTITGNTDIKDWNFNASELLESISTMNTNSGYLPSVVQISEGVMSWSNTNYEKVMNLVMKRFREHYVYWTENDLEDTDKAEVFVSKLVYILEMTSPRYLKLLEVYNSADSELLDPVKIESEGVSRFNDTPQDSGTFDTDSHTTNLTEDSRTTSNDLDTKMGRIREIESNYNNLLLKWSNEFESLFLEEANI